MAPQQARQHFAATERFIDESLVRSMLTALGFVSEPPAPDLPDGAFSRAALSKWMATAQRGRIPTELLTRGTR
jgi:hypothetical protein